MFLTLNLEQLFCSKARAKTIKVLAENKTLNISAIIKLTKLNHKVVESHLEFLTEAGIVEEKRYGKVRIFRFKEENIKAKGIKNLIKLIENF